METPKVSVLIATWNRKDEVLDTIQSVYAQDYPSFEIIVVDNGSNDGTADAVRLTYPNARLIALDRNLGPTGGRNAGIKIARGEIIFCLDSDASLDRHALQYIVQRLGENPDIGVINSKIVNAYSEDFDQNAGWAYSEKQRVKSDLEFATHCFSEGGCAIRMEVFERVGLFWERLFFGREGEDLGLRVLDVGYKILYYPAAIVYHRISPQKRPINWNSQFYDLRNSLYIYLARYPWWLLILFVPLKICASSLRGLRRGKITWVFRALWDVIRDLPALWKERHPIQSDTACTYLRFLREQGALSWDLASWLRYKT